MDFSLFEVSEPFTVGSPNAGLLGITITIAGKKTLIAITHECIHEIADYIGEPSYELAKHLFSIHKDKILCDLYDQLLKLQNEHRYLVKRKDGKLQLEPY